MSTKCNKVEIGRKKGKKYDKSRIVERAQWLCKIIADIRDRAEEEEEENEKRPHLHTHSHACTQCVLMNRKASGKKCSIKHPEWID